MNRGNNTKEYWEKKHIREWNISEKLKYDELPVNSYTKVAIDLILENLSSVKNKTVLEMGCADGKAIGLFKELLPDDWACEGWDFGESAIQAAKNKYPNVTFKCIDFLETKITNNYGWICMFETIEHIEEGTNYKILDNMLQHSEFVILSTVNTKDDCFGEHISHYDFDTFEKLGYNVIWKSYLAPIKMPDGIYYYMIFLLKGKID